MQQVRLALTGFGNVGRGIATLLQRHGDEFEQRYGLRLVLTGVADQGGAATAPGGLDLGSLLQAKAESGTVASHSRGEQKLGGAEFLDRTGAGLLLETASTNFEDAEPGWSYCLAALDREMDIVLASKGALTLYWSDLMNRARSGGRSVRYSATIGAPLPSLDVAERTLAGLRARGFEGIVNGTTNVILTLMEGGATYAEGVTRAQEIGIAETDPTLDVDGWDAAAKTVILANAVLAADLRLHDVRRTGIRGVSSEEMRVAAERNETIKLIASATRHDGHVVASVRPERRSKSDALGRLRGGDMGFVFLTDLYGRVSVSAEDTDHQGALPTSMTVLRDVINLAVDRGWTDR